jgi:hypothetical protein
MQAFELIRRERCALCDMAQAICDALALTPATVRHVEDDTALEDRYGWHVPVMVRADGAELRWPFDAVSVQKFLQGPGEM